MLSALYMLPITTGQVGITFEEGNCDLVAHTRQADTAPRLASPLLNDAQPAGVLGFAIPHGSARARGRTYQAKFLREFRKGFHQLHRLFAGPEFRDSAPDGRNKGAEESGMARKLFL